MSIVGLIKALLQTLHAYLQLRNKTFYHDIHKESKKKQKDLVDEIENLRNERSASATDRADLLLSELIKEKQYLKHISTFYTSIDPGYGRTDERGKIQSTD